MSAPRVNAHPAAFVLVGAVAVIVLLTRCGTGGEPGAKAADAIEEYASSRPQLSHADVEVRSVSRNGTLRPDTAWLRGTVEVAPGATDDEVVELTAGMCKIGKSYKDFEDLSTTVVRGTASVEASCHAPISPLLAQSRPLLAVDGAVEAIVDRSTRAVVFPRGRLIVDSELGPSTIEHLTRTLGPELKDMADPPSIEVRDEHGTVYASSKLDGTPPYVNPGIVLPDWATPSPDATP